MRYMRTKYREIKEMRRSNYMTCTRIFNADEHDKNDVRSRSMKRRILGS